MIELDAVSGGTTRQAQLMVPVGKPETGESLAVADTRTSKAPTSYNIKAKLSKVKTSTVQMTAIISLSSGLTADDITSSAIEFGFSSIHTKIQINAKGKVTTPP